MPHLRLGVVILTLAGLCLSGCRQHTLTFMAENDQHKNQAPVLPSINPEDADETPACSAEARTVTTALNPTAQKRPISLQECIAMALENGRTGRNFGQRVTATGVPPPGGALSLHTDSIRVYAFDPAAFGATVERSLARFDAIWQSSMSWNKVDEPANNIVFGGMAFTPGVLDADQAQFRSGLLKPLPTGGLAGITFQTDYNLSNQPFRLQPSYKPALTFGFEQPLLQGAGVEINQLRDLHPTGGLLPFLPSGAVPGIMLARISLNQSQDEFERQVHELLFAVEEAYWELYFAYWDLYARDAALLQAFTLWQIVEDRFQAGRIDAASKAQTESQLQSFRADRLQALSRGRLGRLGVLEAERKLRYLLGLPYEDGYRLIPSDTPTVTPIQPDWNSAYQEALARRPELRQARLEVQAAQLVVKRERNYLLPELRFFANYNINSLDRHLDDAISMLVDNRFNNWMMGLRAEVPIGFRAASAEVRKANLRLGQAFFFLRDQEQKVKLDLQRSYRDIVQAAKEIEYRRAQREQAAIEVRGRFENFVNGKPGVTLDVLADLLLRAQRNFADALTEEHRAIYEYNTALADFELQKGTIMEHDNVHIAEGPMPAYAVARASKHIRDFRVKRDESVHARSGLRPSPSLDNHGAPELPTGDPPPMPHILERNKGMNELLEKPPVRN